MKALRGLALVVALILVGAFALIAETNYFAGVWRNEKAQIIAGCQRPQ